MSSPSKPLVADRFIPIRNPLIRDWIGYSAGKFRDFDQSTNCSELIKATVSIERKKVFTFSKDKSSKTLQVSNQFKTKHQLMVDDLMPIQMSNNGIKILQPDKIIDAPNALNNYYTNVLDWSRNNIVGVGLSHEAYLRFNDENIQELPRNYFNNITSVKFNQSGELVFLGDELGFVEMIDICKNTIIRVLKAHHERVGCIERYNEQYLITGSKDRDIKIHDLRRKESIVQVFKRHKGEICGLDIKNQKIASGANDNHVLIWDLKTSKLISKNTYHKGAVKAIKWCPWSSNLLATGGGMNDKKIVFWSSETNSILKAIDVKNQVTGLHWRENESNNELITSHSGKNQNTGHILIWDYNTENIRYRCDSHQSRVLAMAVNPQDQNQFCTLAAGIDEDLRYWKVPARKELNNSQTSNNLSGINSMSLKQERLN